MTLQLCAAAAGPEGRGRVVSVLEGGCAAHNIFDLFHFLSTFLFTALQLSFEEEPSCQRRGRWRLAQGQDRAFRYSALRRLFVRFRSRPYFVTLQQRKPVPAQPSHQQSRSTPTLRLGLPSSPHTAAWLRALWPTCRRWQPLLQRQRCVVAVSGIRATGADDLLILINGNHKRMLEAGAYALH